MSEYDDRMRRLLECEPSTSCEKWAIARIKELEAMVVGEAVHELESQLEECVRDNHQLERDKDELIRKLADADAMLIKAGDRIRELTMERAKSQCDGLEMAVRILDKHGFKEAAARVQALLDGAFI